MSMFVKAILLILLLVVGGTVAVLAAFDPKPQVSKIERVVPNDRFGR